MQNYDFVKRCKSNRKAKGWEGDHQQEGLTGLGVLNVARVGT